MKLDLSTNLVKDRGRIRFILDSVEDFKTLGIELTEEMLENITNGHRYVAFFSFALPLKSNVERLTLLYPKRIASAHTPKKLMSEEVIAKVESMMILGVEAVPATEAEAIDGG